MHSCYDGVSLLSQSQTLEIVNSPNFHVLRASKLAQYLNDIDIYDHDNDDLDLELNLN